MKGIVLTGGKGTRLFPLTDPLSKEMLPVYNRPMVIHAIRALLDAGIHEFAFITNTAFVDFYRRMLGNFEYDPPPRFFVEESRRGPGYALLLAEEWIGKQDFAVMLGDSLFFAKPPFLPSLSAPRLFVMRMNPSEDEIEKYTQLRVQGENVVAIRQKPARLFSELIQTTIFLFPADVFDLVRNLSALPEIRISDIVAKYVEQSRMKFTTLPEGYYLDCGTFDALIEAGVRIKQQVDAMRRK